MKAFGWAGPAACSNSLAGAPAGPHVQKLVDTGQKQRAFLTGGRRPAWLQLGGKDAAFQPAQRRQASGPGRRSAAPASRHRWAPRSRGQPGAARRNRALAIGIAFAQPGDADRLAGRRDLALGVASRLGGRLSPGRRDEMVAVDAPRLTAGRRVSASAGVAVTRWPRAARSRKDQSRSFCPGHRRSVAAAGPGVVLSAARICARITGISWSHRRHVRAAAGAVRSQDPAAPACALCGSEPMPK